MNEWDKLPGTRKPKTIIPEAEKLVVYYQQYAEILKKYEDQVRFIWEKLESIREERVTFMSETIPEIKKTLEAQQISKEYADEWMASLTRDMNRSLNISEELLNDFYVAKADELRKEIHEKLSIGGDS